jgi:hypothetical protein
MQENKTDQRIREKLQDATLEAPDFETLLGRYSPEELRLRASCGTKLRHHSTEAPAFETLFADGIPTPMLPLKPRTSLWWMVGLTAAACLMGILFLPRLFTPDEGTREALLQPARRVAQPHRHTHSATPHASGLAAYTPPLHQTLAQKNIEPLPVNDTVASVSESMATRDSLRRESPLMASNAATGLLPTENQSLKPSNTTVRLRKVASKRDHAAIRLNLNASNRLFSQFNDRSSNGYALNTMVASSAEGYSRLEGASSAALRSATTSSGSVNEWISPDNLDRSTYSDCQTTYNLPVNVGISLSIPLLSGVNLLTGLQYTYLNNRIAGNNFTINQELHYLGIPAKIGLDLVRWGRWTAYMAAGGTIEKGLVGVVRSTVVGDGTWKGTQPVHGLSTSLTGQLGLSCNLLSDVAAFVEPGASWYIPSNQPISSRTEEPLHFNVSFGMRYQLK